MTDRLNVLVLGGTSEASALVRRLAASEHFAVTLSLAGRTAEPVAHGVPTRVGGFGGADGLIRYLREQRTDAVVDATHPFAAQMPWNACAACATACLPLLRIERPPWTAGPGDRWRRVPALAAAAAALGSARRVFLTTGRQELAPFAGQPGRWFLVRSIEPPGPLPFDGEAVLGKGPFDVEDEAALMRLHRIDLLVTKNSGAAATAPKLAAARQLGIPVIMVERPPKPAGSTASDVEGAIAWLPAVVGKRETRLTGTAA